MSCNCRRCCNNRNSCKPECKPVERKEICCPEERKVIKHEYVVKHRHDIIHEYDVLHEHDYNIYDVVKTREVVRENDCTSHKGNFCDDKKDCDD